MSKYKELIKIVTENPELKVIPLVHQDCCSDDFNYTVAKFTTPWIEEYCYYKNKMYCEGDLTELVEEVWNDMEDPEASEEEAKKIVEGFKWKKAIFVNIEA